MRTTVLRPDSGRRMVPGPSQASRAQILHVAARKARLRQMRQRLSPLCPLRPVCPRGPQRRDGGDPRRLSAWDPPWCSLFGGHDGREGSERLVTTLQIYPSTPRQTARSHGAWAGAPPTMSWSGRVRYHHPGRRSGPVTGRDVWPRW